MNHIPARSWIDRLLTRPILISLILFTVALILRLLAVGRYVTPDELIWVYRSVLFREAILAGHWAESLVAGHPGVTTTWLGTIAISLQLALQPGDLAAYNWIRQMAYLTPDNMEAFRQLSAFLSSGRTAVAIVNSLGIVAVFWLVKALLNGRIALLAAFLLAIDPFFAGLSGLLHVDGLLSTWSILSLLLIALAVRVGDAAQENSRRIVWCLLSGAAAALAVLSKSPGILLIAIAGLAIVSLLWRERGEGLGRRVTLVLGFGAAWLAAFLLVLLIYPALWSTPPEVLSFAGGNASRHVSEALRPTYFMGDVAFDHGPLFYPVALLWRLSPLVLGGLLLFLIFLIQRRRFVQRDRQTIVIMAIWVLLFLVGITLTAKKFDRYALPVFPALTVLAAIALAGRKRIESTAVKLIIILLAAAQMLMLISGLPYLLAAYNPLVGGPLTAQAVMPLGWGEAVSAAGRWLVTQPEANEQTAVSGIAPSLAPFFTGETLFAETSGPQNADWIIITANGNQVAPDAVAEAVQEYELSRTVQYGLLPQAWIYHNLDPHKVDIIPQVIPDPPSFGGQMKLVGQDIGSGEGEVSFTARWEKESADPELAVKLRLVDQLGNTWQELETDLLNEVYFYPRDWQLNESPVITYRLKLPIAIPPGAYTVLLSLVDQKDGALLAVQRGETGGVIYEAGPVEISRAEDTVDLSALEMVPSGSAVWLDGDLKMAGIVDVTPVAQAGGDLFVELIWQTAAPLPANMRLALKLGDTEPVALPLGNTGSQLWEAGTVLRQKYRFPVPSGIAAGDYQLAVELLDGSGQALGPEPYPIGEVRIESLDRIFTLPDDIALTLDTRFEPGIMLRGVSPAVVSVHAGEALPFSLTWQTDIETEELLSTFVHLLDAEGNIVAQNDQWPGGTPTVLWSPGQVIVDEHRIEIPEDLPAGEYRLAAGLYTADDGVRLPAFDASGEHLAENRVTLPLVVRIAE